jgi:hypothetical protein
MGGGDEELIMNDRKFHLPFPNPQWASIIKSEHKGGFTVTFFTITASYLALYIHEKGFSDSVSISPHSQHNSL